MSEFAIAIATNDAAVLAATVAQVSAHQEWIQIDIADGTLTDYETVKDVKVLAQIIRDSGRSFEAHLLVSEPHRFVKPLVDAGFSRLIAHVEANDPRRFIEEAQLESVEAGIALQATSELDQVEPFIEESDFVVLMTAEIGSTESPFLPETIEKVKTIRINAPDVTIVVEGGLNVANAQLVHEAGASRLVVSSEMFLHHKESFLELLAKFREV